MNENELEWNDPDRPHAPNGVLSLVCGIIGLALLVLAWLLPDDGDLDFLLDLIIISGVVASIISMVTGIKGTKQIKDHMDDYSDSNKVVTGRVLGIIGVAGWAIMMMIGFVYILFSEGIEGFL